MEELKRIIETFGDSAQKVVAIEEMSELIKEICKDMRGKTNRDGMIEEIADVQIMLWQLRAMYHIDSSELEAVIRYKIKRTLQRIDNDPSLVKNDMQTYTTGESIAK